MKKFKVAEAISWTRIDTEIFVINEKNENITILRNIDMTIWESITNEMCFKEIVNDISQKYVISPNEILKKIKIMLQKELIEYE